MRAHHTRVSTKAGNHHYPATGNMRVENLAARCVAARCRLRSAVWRCFSPRVVPRGATMEWMAPKRPWGRTKPTARDPAAVAAKPAHLSHQHHRNTPRSVRHKTLMVPCIRTPAMSVNQAMAATNTTLQQRQHCTCHVFQNRKRVANGSICSTMYAPVPAALSGQHDNFAASPSTRHTAVISVVDACGDTC